MKITPFDVHQQQFQIRFRGFDIREVDAFLERTADLFDELKQENENLKVEIQRLRQQIQGHLDREQTIKRAMVNSQKALDQMKENARKSGEIIVAEAEVAAEKILHRAHNRFVQLHEDISELKRQRLQIEVQIHSVLDAHAKLLELSKESMKAVDDEESKIMVLKQPR
jgi:cell division initiation protein